ncbi:polymorphic toxin type 22 domain-containing protein, partial [Caballeronia sp. LZ032]|uniref:polymorphic toxin type 22 domain-containing protein n=1 Tax=Caballeronia sp. LZ032 TaxID=3038565 RepID=UPI002865F38E
AVIVGADDAAKNSLSTGTLTFADVGNHSHYSANSIGGSVGLSPGPSSDKAVGPASVPGSGGLVPMIGQHENGDQSSTTRSAISPGTITLTDVERQAQDVANLSRDTTSTNGTVASTPDVNEILNQQADTMQAAQAAGQVVAQGIGAYADMEHNLAEANHDQAGAAAWAEGGEYRIAMHIAGGAAVAGLGGGSVGSAAQGAAGAGISAAAAGKLDELSHDIAASSPTGNADADRALGNIIANVLATGAGAAVGGSSGASAASSVDLYNRSAHDGAGGDKRSKDLVAQVCPATVQCSDAMLSAEIQAQGDNAQLALGAMSPDYVSIQGNIYIASGGVVINLHNGDTFGSWALGKPIPTYSLKPGLSVTFGSILGGGGAAGTSSYLAGGGANASTFVPVPALPAIGVGGGISHAYGGQTSIEYGFSFPPGTAVNPISYGFDMKK